MTLCMTTSNSTLSKLEDVKLILRCILISLGSRDVTLKKLNSIYYEEEGVNIPYKEFNFTGLKEFLRSMPGVLTLEWNEKLKSYCAYHIDTEKTKHISSLKAREKKKPSTGKKSKSQLLQEKYNTVDPHLLLEVLKELRTKNSRIRKEDILTEINKRIGTYSFYNIRNLNSQLSEFFHLLHYDSDYIYFKESLQETKSKFQNKIINENEASKKTVNLNIISDFINETIQERLIILIERYPNGIWCSEIPKLYVKEFGFDLQYASMGFNSIIEFVAALPHIFKIIMPSNIQKQMVVDARRDSKDLLTTNFITSTPTSKSFESAQTDAPPCPLQLSPKVSKFLIPENTMNFDETVEQITVSDLFRSNPMVDVIVSDIYNPSFFWIILRKNKKKLDKLMFELQNFYSQQDLEKYKIAGAVLQPGLNIACIFADMWHRGIIKSIKPNSLEIFFYDYGTIDTYNCNEVYHLEKKFAALPAQAIPCELYNIHPIDSNKWPSGYSKKFEKKVFNKAFVASIFDIDEENNSMIINLIDTSSDVEEYINEWMIKMRMAKWGTHYCKKNNYAFQHYQECLKITENGTNENSSKMGDRATTEKCLKIVESENKISFTSINLIINKSPKYIDNKKRIEFINKYKAERLSSSLSTLSLTSTASSTSENSDSLLSSESAVASVYHLNGNDSDKKQDKMESNLIDQSKEEKIEQKFSSKNLSGSQSSLFSTDSFISYTSSDKSSLFTSDCSKLMFKSPTESTASDRSYSSSNRKTAESTQKTFPLKELKKLLASVKKCEKQITIPCV